jgi:hypothetical protein
MARFSEKSERWAVATHAPRKSEREFNKKKQEKKRNLCGGPERTKASRAEAQIEQDVGAGSQTMIICSFLHQS